MIEERVRDEFRHADERPLKSINDVLTLDDLRRKQAQEQDSGFNVATRAEDQTHSTGYGLRKKKVATNTTNTALQLAKQQLQHDRPEVIDRAERALGQVGVTKQNRSYRLNSLGVFQSDVNEVRASSMQGVELYKGLSAATMRLTNYQSKDVKLNVPNESVANRLEKMYTKVLKSVDDKPKHARPTVCVTDIRTTARGGGLTAGTPSAYGPRCHTPLAHSSSIRSIRSHSSRPPLDPNACRTLLDPNASRTPLDPNTSRTPLDPNASRTPSDPNTSRSPLGPTASCKALPSFGPRSSSVPLQHRPSCGVPPLAVKDTQRLYGTQRSFGSNSARSFKHSDSSMGLIKRNSSSARAAGSGWNHSSPMASNSGAGNATTSSRLDWSKLTLPPEVAVAQARHIASLAEKHQAMYHQKVLEAQAALVANMGMPDVTINMTEEELEGYLVMRAIEMGLDDPRFDPNDPNTKEVSKTILAPSSLREMLTAAAKHADIMTGEFDEMKADMAKSAWAEPAKLDHFKAKLTHAQKDIHSKWRISDEWSISDELIQSGLSRTCVGASTSMVASHRMGRERSQTTSRALSHKQGGGASIGNLSQQESGAGAGLSEDDSSMGEGAGKDEELMEPPGMMNSRSMGGKSVGETAGPNTAREQGQPQTVITQHRLAQYQQKVTDAMTEVALPSFHVPRLKSLPELPDAPTASQHLQARLERLWTLLKVPLTQRLDMVLSYTKQDRANQFEEAVGMWEECTALMLHRQEKQHAIELLRHNLGEGLLGSLSVTEAERLAIGLVQATEHLKCMCQRLESENGGKFAVEGKAYILDEHDELEMWEFMNWLASYCGPVCFLA